MKDESAGALFEGLLIGGGGSGRGSAFGTSFIPVYNPLNTPPIRHSGAQHVTQTAQEAFDNHHKCCGGTKPSCKGCDNCGTR